MPKRIVSHRLHTDRVHYEYTEAEHKEVMKLRALYQKCACIRKPISEYFPKLKDAMNTLDGGTYSPKIGGEDVDG